MTDEKFIPDNFEELFHKNYEKLCMIAVRYVQDIDLARDLVQEFFVYVWSRRMIIQLQSTFEAYAARSIRNICITYTKRQKKHVLYYGDSLPDIGFDLQQSQQEQSEREKIYQALNTAIQKLPEQRRKIFLMSNLEGLTYLEIALRNNISVNTVKAQIKKAYATLRSELPKGILVFIFLMR
ncbi:MULTISPECIES: RNA polymerase sigma-70 factor [Sphingobacterium]|uniref:RNA polymerase sigma-70 factor n=1 Tax=Sphingobacterium TaxID=28453 RepID=UPI0013DAD60B|nr:MULTISPECIES: RNA polymerase sigma-70 factor [unclassified Sphingobacterium]